MTKATTEQLQNAVIRTTTSDGFNDLLATRSMSDSSSRLSNEEAVAIYDELERLGELSANELPCDGSHKDFVSETFGEFRGLPGEKACCLAEILDHAWTKQG